MNKGIRAKCFSPGATAVLAILLLLAAGLPGRPSRPPVRQVPENDGPRVVQQVEDEKPAERRRRKRFPWVWAGAGILVAGTVVFLLRDRIFGPGPQLDFRPLEFPFQDWRRIKRIAAFGVPNWSGSEPHNGIDLIVESPALIVSPTAGTVAQVKTSENPFSNPPGQLILTVEIYINSDWTVSLCFEPGTTDPTLKNQQKAAIAVSKGDRVAAGQAIGTLLAGEQGYVHLHYMVQNHSRAVCPYTYSSSSARTVFETLKNTRAGNYLPDGRICYGEE